MRSVYAMAISVFIAVCAAGYAITWYSQAMATRRGIEQAIAQVNQNQPYITYEGIEYSGFPSNVRVSVVRPHFKGRVDQLLQALHAAAKRPGAPAQSEPALDPWNEDLVLDGRITVGINALSDHYSVAVSGNWTENASIGAQHFSSLHQQLSDFTCTLQLQRNVGLFDTLWNFDTLNRPATEFFNDFRMLDCNSAGQQTTDIASKQPLTSTGIARLYITNTPEQGVTQFRFYLKAADIQIMPAGDAMIAAYFHAVSPDYVLPLNFSGYGKQNLDMDFTYSGPTDAKADFKNALLDVALNKMDFTNAVYSYHNTFHYSNLPAAGSRASNLSLRSESHFTPQYNQMAQNMVRNFIRHMYDAPDPRMALARQQLQQYTPDQLYSIVYPAIPDFAALGRVVTSVDGNFRGAGDFSTGDYTLDGMELSATPYGLIGKGNLKMAAGKPSGANFQLSCSNCLAMIDAMVDYAVRFQKVMAYINPGKAGLPVDPASAGPIKQFLSLLSVPSADPNDKTTLGYVIAYNGQGVTINNKTMAEINAMYNEYLRPILKTLPQSAPSPVPPAPPAAPAQ